MKISCKKNNKFHYSPLRYPGGKTSLHSFFDRVIKRNGLHNLTYVEPYAGGAGAALALLFLEKVDKIVINDLDRAIYSFWKSSIFESERFIDKIKSVPITLKEWYKQKAIYSNASSNEFDLGFSTFFLNRTNVSGIIEGGPIGGIKQTSEWKINVRYNKEKLIERIDRIAMYRNRISVFNKDGIKIINKYLKRKNTFIYLDPPYFEKGAALYLNHFIENDHKKLAQKLNNNNNSTWLLTYDNKKEIKLLYPERRIINFSLNYNAYKARKGREILIASDLLLI